MNGIEKYVRENIGAFDTAAVPEGSKEAFLSKLSKERRRGRTVILSFTTVAAAAAIVLSVMPGSLEIQIRQHHRMLADKEKEILEVMNGRSPEEVDGIRDVISGIITETIPLEEQLPEELGIKERREILSEYYHNKYLALEDILNLYTESH